MSTPLSSAEGLSVWCSLRNHSDGGSGRMGLCGVQPGWLFVQTAKGAPVALYWRGSTRERTAIMAWHQLLFPVSVSSLQSVPVWSHGLCPAAPGSRMLIRGTGGVDSPQSQKPSCQTLPQVCVCLLITTQSVSISFDLWSRLWPANLPMSVLGHSRMC